MAENGLSPYEAVALRQTPDAVIGAARSGEILHWNGGAEQIFGYADFEAIRRRPTTLTMSLDRVQEEDRLIAEKLTNGYAIFGSLRRKKVGALAHADISSNFVTEATISYILPTKKDAMHLKIQRDAKQVEAGFQDLLVSKPAPPIVVTAFSMPGDRDKAGQAACDGYCSKPITPQTLGAEIEAVLLPISAVISAVDSSWRKYSL